METLTIFGWAGLSGLVLFILGVLVAVAGAIVNTTQPPPPGPQPRRVTGTGFWSKLGDAIKKVADVFAKTVAALVTFQGRVLARIMRPVQRGDQLLFLGIWIMILGFLLFAIAGAIWLIGQAVTDPPPPDPTNTPSDTPSPESTPSPSST